MKKYAVRLFLATIVRFVRVYFLRIKGYDISSSAIIEKKVRLDLLYPKGIHIGNNTLVASGSIILSHDHCKRIKDNQPFITDTYIGNKCFIAVNSIILPGVKIGDEVIVGAGSVVTKDVPSKCIVGGNPAKIIRSGIEMNDFAAINNWDEINGWKTK